MPELVRCPECRALLEPAEEGATPSFCHRALPGPMQELGSKEERRPPTRRRRRSRNRPHRFDFMGLLRAGGAAVLLIAASLLVALVVRLITSGQVAAAMAAANNPPQQAAPAPPIAVAPNKPPVAKAPAAPPAPAVALPTRWEVVPDPAPAAPPATIADAGVPLNGEPLFAAGGGLFFVDTPMDVLNWVTALHDKEGPSLPVHDLAAGKPLGNLPKECPRTHESRLSPDGRLLLARGLTGPPGQKNPYDIWLAGVPKPAGSLVFDGGAFWMNFASPDELVVAWHDTIHSQLEVWSVSQRKALHSFPLPASLFPPAKEPGALMHIPDSATGALSPGGKYLALGHATGILLVSLTDGRPIGMLPLGGAGEKIDYRGLRFSDDGEELTGIVGLRQERKSSTRLISWMMTDGTPSLNVEVAPNTYGPPLPGPKRDTALVTLQQSVGDKVRRLGQVVDTHNGTVLQALPYTPVRWLDGERLLVVGPIKDAPPGTPLLNPAAQPGDSEERARKREEVIRNDPNVRAVYAVAAPAGGS
jgi:hypothetical protein